MSEKQKKTRGVSQGIYWNSLATLLGDGQKFIVQLVLARLLLPDDFGKVGMVMVFTTIIFSISELGLSAALIQKKKKFLKEIHFDTVFWMSIGFGIALFTFISLVVAPFVVWFYNEPILLGLTILVSASVFIAPLGIVHRTRLIRHLDFKAIAIAKGTSSFLAGVICIFMAYNGGGVWSMALMGPLTSLIALPFLWYMAKWMPRFRFSKQALRDVFGFGAYVALEKGTMAIAQNIDYLLIGKILGAHQLGIYTLAFMLTDTLRSKISSVLGTVLFPVYSKVQSDKASLKRYYLLTVRYSSLTLFPILALLIVAGDKIVLLWFGEKWSESIFPLQMLALAGIIHTIGGTSSIVLRAMGKSKLEFHIYFLKTLFITIPAIVIGVHIGGINGAAIATVTHKIAMRFIQQHYMKKYIDATEIDIIRSITPSLIACIAMSITVYELKALYDSTLWLLICMTAGICIYTVVIAYVAPDDTKRILSSLRLNRLTKGK